MDAAVFTLASSLPNLSAQKYRLRRDGGRLASASFCLAVQESHILTASVVFTDR